MACVTLRIFGYSSEEDESDVEDLDAHNAMLLDEYEETQQRRYTFRRSYRKRRRERIEDDLIEADSDSSDGSGERPWLSSEEFLQKYRMSRDSFRRLVDLIKDHAVFKEKDRWSQASASCSPTHGSSALPWNGGRWCFQSWADLHERIACYVSGLVL